MNDNRKTPLGEALDIVESGQEVSQEEFERAIEYLREVARQNDKKRRHNGSLH